MRGLYVAVLKPRITAVFNSKPAILHTSPMICGIFFLQSELG
jgi:hypothetical protein